jgi:hypothetical protein
LVLHLAARLGWQAVMLRPGQCSSRELGGTESQFRTVLSTASSVGPAIVAFEFDSEWGRTGLTAGPELRLLPLLVDWLRHLPPFVVVLVTASPGTALPRELASILDDAIDLPLLQTDVLSGLLGVLFKRHRLQKPATATPFTAELAARISGNGMKVRAPESGLPAAPSFSTTLRTLTTAADVQAWVHDTLLLHRHDPAVRDPEFWHRRAV